MPYGNATGIQTEDIVFSSAGGHGKNKFVPDSGKTTQANQFLDISQMAEVTP